MDIAKPTAAALLLLCAGCADRKIPMGGTIPWGTKAPRQSDCCQVPDFAISLHSKKSQVPDVHITERDGAVTVAVGDRKRVIRRTGDYRELRSMIQNSRRWRETAGESYYRGPWSGPVRDMLTVSRGASGVNLQGDDVPALWKRSIQQFARGFIPPKGI